MERNGSGSIRRCRQVRVSTLRLFVLSQHSALRRHAHHTCALSRCRCLPQAHACSGRRTLVIASGVSAECKRSPLIWRSALTHTSYVHARADFTTETRTAVHARLWGSGYVQTWLILPVVICLSQRLSHACLSISFYTAKLRMAH